MKYNIKTEDYYKSAKLLLTPNQRLARKLHDYCYSTKQDNQTILLKFNIQSLNDFISEVINLIFESGVSDKPLYLIDSWQRELVLKKIINDHNDYDLAVESVYKKVEQAWVLANDWHLDWRTWQDYPQLESKLFTKWLLQYELYLNNNNFLDPNRIIDYLITQSKLINISKIFNSLCVESIDLYGFDDLTPAQESLFDALRNGGIDINNIDNIGLIDSDTEYYNKNQYKIFTANNIEQEYYAVASWARSCLEEGISNIGIVVPNLAQHRRKLIKVFEQLIPSRTDWNISGGDILSEVPLVKVSLILLNLVVHNTISLEDIKYLLNSKYYLRNSNNDKISAGSIDLILAELEFHGYKNISLKLFVEKFSVLNVDLCRQLVLDHELVEKELYLPSKWAKKFSNILSKLGWPSGVGLAPENNIFFNISSLEFQAIQQFNSGLKQLYRLDNILGSTTGKKIYYELNNLLKNTIFQIQTDNTKIDILGMLEGAGINFDKLWLFNFTSDVWPQSPQPNPFIPVEIQKKHNLPQTTSEREYLYAKRLTIRYLTSSEDIVISYSKHDDDHENKLSLLFDYHSSLVEANKYLTKYLKKQPDIHLWKILSLSDEAPKLDNSYIKSGVRALSLQADCPFKAFSEIRLNAKRNFKLDIGPAAWLRGQMIHKVLELLFKKYKSKDELQKLFEFSGNCKKYLCELISEVIQEYKKIYENILTNGVALIEQELIYTIVYNWIQLELTRDNYEVVALEQEFLVRIENIEFKVRVDRIDKVNNSQDHLIIIDYKTSVQNINHLLRDQVTDLQLPIYLAIDKLKKVDAVVYAEVLEENFGFKGISNFEINLDGCIHTDNWQYLVDNWQNNLNSLALSFSSGEAYITGKQFPQVCTSCHLSSLCRKDEVIND